MGMSDDVGGSAPDEAPPPRVVSGVANIDLAEQWPGAMGAGSAFTPIDPLAFLRTQRAAAAELVRQYDIAIATMEGLAEEVVSKDAFIREQIQG